MSKKDQKIEAADTTPAEETQAPGTALGQKLLEVLDTLEPGKSYDVTFQCYRDVNGPFVIQNLAAHYRKRT